MTFAPTRLALLALLCATAATPGLAESFASSASSAGSASLGSVSDSIKGSSNSSSPNRQVAEGDYRVIEIADVADRPGVLRLRLEASQRSADSSEFFLDLPQAALGTRGLAAGDVVSARRRPYGLEFARADTREAFFLVLADDWYRELDAHALTL
jgi:hypothetical protein